MGNWKKTILLLKTKRLKTNNNDWPTPSPRKTDNLEDGTKFIELKIPKANGEEREKVK